MLRGVPIKKVTCLLVEDGKKLSFVHLGVQEFFAARFIKTRPDSVAIHFYTQLASAGKWQKWREELIFIAPDRQASREQTFLFD
jgi:hypothetical protein